MTNEARKQELQAETISQDKLATAIQEITGPRMDRAREK